MLSKKIKLIFLLVTCAAVLFVVKQINLTNEEPDKQATKSQKLPKGFLQFYDTFHQDSSFQLQHILFPLQGHQTDSLGNTHPNTWQPDSWKQHRPISFLGTTYQQVFEVVPGFITDIIYSEQYSLTMIRRFVETGDTYMLVYYKELGPAISTERTK